MKYLSIDIETTGLNTQIDQILSIGIIIEDTKNKLSFEEIPKLHIIIPRNRIEGGTFAINMNKNLIEKINNWNEGDENYRQKINEDTEDTFVQEELVCKEIFNFLDSNLNFSLNINNRNRLNVAGKNFGTFDKLFIERLPRWKQYFKINQRILDPSVLYWKPDEDETLPNLITCKKRAGIEGEVTHNALEDAWDVIQLLRKTY